MKKSLFSKLTGCAVFVFAVFCFAGCGPSVKIKAGANNSAEISFSTDFSKETLNMLEELTGSAGGSSKQGLFSEAEVKSFITGTGASDVKASVGFNSKIDATGKISDLSENVLTKAGILKSGKNFLSFTFGPEQLVALYGILDEDSKGYLDLLLLPALNDEQMTREEYTYTLSSVYGPELAFEVALGKMHIELESPDGKKSIKETIELGDLFTLTAPKTWSLNW